LELLLVILMISLNEKTERNTTAVFIQNIYNYKISYTSKFKWSLLNFGFFYSVWLIN